MRLRQLTMLIIQQWIFLILLSFSAANVERNSSIEQILDAIFTVIGRSNDTSSVLLSDNQDPEMNSPEPVFHNDYSETLATESDVAPESFHPGPQFEAIWKFIDKETVRMNFSLFFVSNFSDDSDSSNSNKNPKESFRYPRMVAIPSRTNHSIDSLKYYLFTIRQYKTNTETALNMQQLFLKRTLQRDYDHFSNSLLLHRLNPKEKYSVCIYYYQRNNSAEMPDLFICQDIIHDHFKHSTHGLLFVVTQYSIILGILVVLQSLYSMRKRRFAHTVHQHLINKTQRIRSTLSSVSLIRQSFSSMDVPVEQHSQANCTRIHHEENKLKKRIISSPAIVLSEPSTPSHHSSEENEPFLRLSSSKNHVHFLLGLDESDDLEVDSSSNEQEAAVPSEPYDDRSDALLSMAHILDTNKPWCKQSSSILPV